MTRTIATLVLGCALLTACGRSEPVGPLTPEVSGEWSYSESLRGFYLACDHDGTIAFVQTGAGLAGSYSYEGACNGPEGFSIERSANGTLESGDVVGRVVTFGTVSDVYGSCSYTGTISNTSSLSISGEVACRSDPYMFSGTWTATK
jgi:hypothetical protein